MRPLAVLAVTVLTIASCSSPSDEAAPSSIASQVDVEVETTLLSPATTTQDTSTTEVSTTTSSTTSTTTTTLPLTLIDPPAESDHDACRIEENWPKPPDHNSNTGFPVHLDMLQADDVVNVSIIPAEWPDYRRNDIPGLLPGTKGEMDLNEQFEQVRIFADFYETISQGRVTFDLRFHDQWVMLPESINEYPQSNVSDFNPKFMQAVVDEVDPDFDFEGTDYLIVIIPDDAPVPLIMMPTTHTGGDGITRSNHGSIQQNATKEFLLETDEGSIGLWMSAGAYFDRKPEMNEWSYYAHEAGHSWELPDYYVIGSWLYSPWDEVEPVEIANGPFNYWSMMGGQDGPSRTINAWSRWMVGWLSEDEVVCYDARTETDLGAFDIQLTPIDIYNGGVKSVIIRTGEFEGYVIESRRPIGPDETLNIWETVGVDPSGVIVYRVDTTKRTTQGALGIIPPDGHFWVDMEWVGPNPHLDALFHDGDTTTISDVEIVVRRVGEDVDTIRLTFD